MSSRTARSNNGCLTNSRICTWYVMMDPKITPSGQTIVKPTALRERRAGQQIPAAEAHLEESAAVEPADRAKAAQGT